MADFKAYSETAISLPFVIDSYGGVAATKNFSKVWADRVASVLGTALEERVFIPEFGTRIPNLILDTESVMEEAISVEVRKAFDAFLQPLKLGRIDISPRSLDDVVQVTVFYTLPDLTDSNTTVGVAAISGTAPINQGVL